MAVIRPIVERAARWLVGGGLLAVEHDDSTAELAVEIFSDTGAFENIQSRVDLTGRPRFVTARRCETARRQPK